ncbi:hypothetical protein BD311DRAFT_739473 [Dichomitus squalens]|uniref:Uncharacterized protein n=1 Tax=Dichomitus squalens TaxID=114155 RepID=A0A4Q9MKM6_9APHY|nr:hypothetical protein BD311DRAFT_739473 [Dichomitus squalens]
MARGQKSLGLGLRLPVSIGGDVWHAFPTGPLSFDVDTRPVRERVGSQRVVVEPVFSAAEPITFNGGQSHIERDEKAAVASQSDAVRELGFNMFPDATANTNLRVDTSDPTYAALLRQWCFVQSSLPAPKAASSPSVPQTKPALRSPAVIRTAPASTEIEMAKKAEEGVGTTLVVL